MGGEQAAHVLATVREDSLAARGTEWVEDEKTAFMNDIRDQYEAEGHPYFASARLWDDGILDPCDTRDALSMALAVVTRKLRHEANPFGIFRM